MRLLRIPPLDRKDELPSLVEFLPDSLPRYAILSHRWLADASQEVSYNDLKALESLPESGSHDIAAKIRGKRGYSKLKHSCSQARKDGLDYIWIDTCCIDKSSSAELSEAINSMYTWYEDSTICYAYLADVVWALSSLYGNCIDCEFVRTDWATRGWTLQELLAPTEVVFYSGDWHTLGTKVSLEKFLSEMTGIEGAYLTKSKSLRSASVAKRMSWAARRKTTRPEDMAYCLLGLFDINMPLLYGEGNKAFIRLQEEIMKQSDDHSLFAWRDKSQDEDKLHGLLATHPRHFSESGNIIPYEVRQTGESYSISNSGIRIPLGLTASERSDVFIATLDCPIPTINNTASFLTIYLKQIPGGQEQYARVRVGHLGELSSPGKLTTLYVRQKPIVPDVKGIMPTHNFQLRSIMLNRQLFCTNPPVHRSSANEGAPILQGMDQSREVSKSSGLEGAIFTCKITSRGSVQPDFAIPIKEKNSQELRDVILLGSADQDVGWSLVSKWDVRYHTEYTRNTRYTVGRRVHGNYFDLLHEDSFKPVQFETDITRGDLNVKVSATTVLTNLEKYYIVDVVIRDLWPPLVDPGTRLNTRTASFKRLMKEWRSNATKWSIGAG